MILSALCEGNSIRATCRMTGAAKGTVLKLLVDIGTACKNAHDQLVNGLECERIECDELWAIVYARQGNIPPEKVLDTNVGDAWTWKCLCSDSKLLVAWRVGSRDREDAVHFMEDISWRLNRRVMLSTDGYGPYAHAVRTAFGRDIDWARCVKYYGKKKSLKPNGPSARVASVDKKVECGAPDMDKVSTSYVERSNLTLRMQQRRFTRSTNAFSKKMDNLRHAMALHAMFYNFCRPHQTLKGKTPAMAAGVAERRWTTKDLAKLLD